MLQAISQTDTVPVVRVPWNDPATIMRALDMGAYGIIVPLVNTAQEAAAAVGGLPLPAGGDALVGPLRAAHYGGANYQAEANGEIVVLAMIETEGRARQSGRDLRHAGARTPSTSGRRGPLLRAGNGAARRQSRPGAHADVRPHPRRRAPARHQGVHALRERGIRGGLDQSAAST